MGLITTGVAPTKPANTSKFGIKWSQKQWNKAKVKIQNNSTPLIESLKNQMLLPTVESNDDR
jgi:hypothetical protein